MTTPSRTTPTSAWAPLRCPVYRRLWLAQVVSNLGTWMQTVAAQWVIVSASGSAALVALVQTASTLPVVLLAAPAGVLADVLDRRRVLVTVQSLMVLVAAALAGLTFAGGVGPYVMLGFTFLLGTGAAFVGPAWQAIQPELVPRAQLPQAAALGAVNMNLARAVGPAVGGLLVAAAGAGWVFALNALSFVVVALAVASWRRQQSADPVGREPLVAALRSGARYVRYAPSMRGILVRTLLFVPAASALWALLPLVATDLLGLGSGGYGMLLGSLGVGAVLAAVVLPSVRARLGVERLLAVLFTAYAGTLVAVALTRSGCSRRAPSPCRGWPGWACSARSTPRPSRCSPTGCAPAPCRTTSSSSWPARHWEASSGERSRPPPACRPRCSSRRPCSSPARESAAVARSSTPPASTRAARRTGPSPPSRSRPRSPARSS